MKIENPKQRSRVPWGTFLLGLVALCAALTTVNPYLAHAIYGHWRVIPEVTFFLIWGNFVGSGLYLEETTLGRGERVSKVENPFFYWLFIELQLVVLLLFPLFYVRKVLSESIEVILVATTMIIVWTVASVVYLRRKYANRSNHDKHTRTSEDSAQSS